MTAQDAIHPSLASGRWRTFSLAEQLGNVGSDFDRAVRAKTQGRTERSMAALDRTLELLDLTANDPRWRGPRRREILRAREQVCRVFFDDTAEPDLASYLQKYFLQFALAARRDVGRSKEVAIKYPGQ